MALFTDGSISTLEDLRGYESAILEVASTERIDLTRKLLLAQEELETELTSLLQQQYERRDLGSVAVTRPLRQWHVFHTLTLAYRDAYNSHFNDRYLGKWKEYDRLSRWAARKLLETGLGIVQNPIPKAETPVVSAGTGMLAAATYWVRVAWTGATGEEGCPSEPVDLALPQGSGLAVQTAVAPPAARGWNVYAGLAADDTRRQNAEPLELGANWSSPESGIEDGETAGSGQPATYFLTQRRVLQRG